MKLVFTPFSIALGLAAGILGRKIFEQIWGLIDEDEPPHPQHRETGGLVKLLAALLVAGGIFRVVPGLAHPRARPTARATPSRGSPAPGGASSAPSRSKPAPVRPPARASGRSHPTQRST